MMSVECKLLGLRRAVEIEMATSHAAQIKKRKWLKFQQ
jgi:hypothetical protein